MQELLRLYLQMVTRLSQGTHVQQVQRIFGVATCLCKVRNQNEELTVLGPQVGTEPSVLAGAI
ncbi:uncharacterized protein N7469_007382 [Penicillium citrinum]|uniref:Uncharacterized protein n=1 Tax=Penicillium citrinum TaxID=5077 RepID=A0A9W9TLM3_PENCI|nr:uncharacterized protein N7469_007382 [Penicillium citrinum]KAJ5227376.1 hypothetical protein N7469_007382 [Penicillium citrinum]